MKNKWFELEYINRNYTNWHFYLVWPGSDSDPEYPSNKYKLSLTIGIYKIFLNIPLFPVNPFKSSWYSDSSKRYGFTFFERSIHLHWGKTWVYFLPWDWKIVRYDLLLPNGNLYHRNNYRKNSKKLYWYEVFESRRSKKFDIDNSVKISETVKLNHIVNNSIQKATITLTGEEREWRWRWFTWLPFPKYISRTVDCSSDIELGSKAGSWKGGLMGWSCEWKHGESMQDAFWRWYENWDGK